MKLQGKIRWFDSLSGEGYVRCNTTQKSYYLHFTAIEGVSKNNHHWPADVDKERLSNIQDVDCEFELSETQISKLVLKKGA